MIAFVPVYGIGEQSHPGVLPQGHVDTGMTPVPKRTHRATFSTSSATG